MTEKSQGEEVDKERVDRELIELLNEIRVALPGAQVLFATGLGVACAVYLVADVVFGGSAAIVATVGVLVTYAAMWLGLPLVRGRWT